MLTISHWTRYQMNNNNQLNCAHDLYNHIRSCITQIIKIVYWFMEIYWSIILYRFPWSQLVNFNINIHVLPSVNLYNSNCNPKAYTNVTTIWIQKSAFKIYMWASKFVQSQFHIILLELFRKHTHKHILSDHVIQRNTVCNSCIMSSFNYWGDPSFPFLWRVSWNIQLEVPSLKDLPIVPLFLFSKLQFPYLWHSPSLQNTLRLYS